MGRGKNRVNALYVVGGFANDLDISDYRILNQCAVQKTSFVDVCCMALNALDGLKNVSQVIRHTPDLVHMGAASANTTLRNLSGSALGVNTSTEMTKSFSSSI